MLAAEFHYVSIDGPMLLEEWRRSAFEVSPSLSALLSHLANPQNEPGSVSRVLAQFLDLALGSNRDPDAFSDLLEKTTASFRETLGERAIGVFTSTRERVAGRHRLAWRQRHLPARLRSTTSLSPAPLLAAELDAEMDRIFERTIGNLLDAGFGS